MQAYKGNIAKKAIILFIILISTGCRVICAQVTGDTLAKIVLQPKALHEDFTLLRRVLTETHPGLYRYSSKESMNRKMDSITFLLDKPMAFYEFYRTLAALVADVRCAHTHIMPRENLEEYFLKQIKTFPFVVLFTEGKHYVVLNGTLDKLIKPRFELLTINSQPIAEIRAKMLRYIWADGYNETLKNKATNEAFFPLFYYILIERPETFLLTFKDPNGQVVNITAAAQTYKETQNLYMKNEVNKGILTAIGPRNKLEAKKGWRLDIRKEERVGVLRIKGFGGGSTEEEARSRMRTFLDASMKKLHDSKIEDLIIDLRHNSGGWDIQGVELFTYLMKEPTRSYRHLHAITDSTEFFKFSDLSAEDLKRVKKELKREGDGTFSVREEFSDQLKVQTPKSNRFVGNVYVLANGGSASTTSEFIAYARSNRSIIIIGEETGGAYEGGNGGSFMNFKLPNSGFYVGTPLLYYENEVDEPKLKGRGTMPDFEVPYNIADILKAYDTQLNFTLELIRKSRK